MTDLWEYSTLCLDGSKECTQIHELAYSNLVELRKLEVAHAMFAILSFIAAFAPMFIVNAWLNPKSTTYLEGVKDNGFSDFWRIAYFFNAVAYGVPVIMTPITYFWDNG